MELCVVILAAGNGTRMYSKLPKVLHKVGGYALLERVIRTAQKLLPHKIYVIDSALTPEVRNSLSFLNVEWIAQPKPLGTGHAVMQALPHIPDSQRMLILYGDVPLITAETLQGILKQTPDEALGVVVAKLINPTGFGRIIRDKENNVVGIVEQKDADVEQLKINEINTGIMVARASLFKAFLPMLSNENAQQEFYLTDLIAMAVKNQKSISTTSVENTLEIQGINNRQELAYLERSYQEKIANELMQHGVTLQDPKRFDCRGELQIGSDVFIDIDVILEGKVQIASGTTIGPYSYLKNVAIGQNVKILSHCVLEDVIVGDNCIIGPFARLRPQTCLAKGAHIGNFVELKNVTMGENSKANHLSYLGDANIGSFVNVGAGTITCNYDGTKKNKTVIEDQVFIGSGTQLVAPIVLGEGAYIGAGSTITKNAPENELTLARARQTTIKGWKKKKEK